MRAGHSRVPHPCATKHCCFVRLACLIHAASVRSEPGSNSPNKIPNTTGSAPAMSFVLQDFDLVANLSIRSFTTTSRFLAKPQNLFLGFIALFNFQRSLALTAISNHHRLHQAQWNRNLACFFRLSNRFLNFFQTFFSTAPGPNSYARAAKHENVI